VQSGKVSSAPKFAYSTYKTWGELAGYFDGDGTIELNVHLFTIETRLAFDENWRPHLEGIRNFLFERSIICGAVRKKESFNTWHLVIAHSDSVIRMAEELVKYTVKKRGELQAALHYLKSETTAEEFVREFNEFVRMGERTGKIRPQAPPYTRSIGKELALRVHLGRARQKIGRA
jgi:hypothetical protein